MNPSPSVSVPFSETVRIAAASNQAGHNAGWKNGLLLAGATGLVMLLVVVIGAQVSQSRAIEKTASRVAAETEKAVSDSFQQQKRTL